MAERAEFQLSPRIHLLAGDPCKVAGKRGLYRFVCVWFDDDDPTETLYTDVVGPLPHHEILRTFRADALRSAGRATRATVAMNAALRELSSRAQHRRP